MVAETVETVAQVKPNSIWAETIAEMDERLRAQVYDWVREVDNCPAEWSNTWATSKTYREIVERNFGGGGYTSSSREDRHRLAVNVDGITLVPMTCAEWIAEGEAIKHDKANDAAQATADSWNGGYISSDVFAPAILFQRGVGITKKAGDWKPQTSRVLLDPQFRAWQIEDGKPEVALAVYDGETFVDCVEVNQHCRRNSDDFVGVGGFGEPLAYFRSLNVALAVKFAAQLAYAPVAEPLSVVKLPMPFLLKSLNLALVAVSDDDTRPILTGVLFVPEGNILRLVATDTYRLTLDEIPADAEGNGNGIVCRHFLAVVKKVFAKAKGEAEIRLDADYVSVTCDGQTLKSRLIYGQFVNYTKVIPQELAVPLTFQPEEMIAAIKELLPIARDDANRVRLTVDSGSTLLQSHSIQASGVDAKVEKRLPMLRSLDEKDVALNGQFLIDYLMHCEGEVEWTVYGPLNSMMFTNGTSRYVLMPMQIM